MRVNGVNAGKSFPLPTMRTSRIVDNAPKSNEALRSERFATNDARYLARAVKAESVAAFDVEYHTDRGNKCLAAEDVRQADTHRRAKDRAENDTKFSAIRQRIYRADYQPTKVGKRIAAVYRSLERLDPTMPHLTAMRESIDNASKADAKLSAATIARNIVHARKLAQAN